MKKLSTHKWELIGLMVYFFVFSFIALVLEFNHLTMSALFAGLPTLFLIFKYGLRWKDFFLASVVSLPLVLTLNTIAHISNAWDESTVFSAQLFGTAPIETFIWTFNYFLFIFLMYETYFDRFSTKKLSENVMGIEYILLGLYIIFGITMAYTPDLIEISYFYAILVLVVIICSVVLTSKMPSGVYKKGSILSLYLFIPSLLYEIVALENGHWFFEKGFHIGYVELIGYTFPFEELVWFLLMPYAFVIVYEYFADNRK